MLCLQGREPKYLMRLSSYNSRHGARKEERLMLNFPDSPIKEAGAKLGFKMFEEGDDWVVARCESCGQESVFGQAIGTRELLGSLEQHQKTCPQQIHRGRRVRV